ncbi:MAG: hypothetical protein AAF497_16795, partial [Planctomycetota bacterium]
MFSLKTQMSNRERQGASRRLRPIFFTTNLALPFNRSPYRTNLRARPWLGLPAAAERDSARTEHHDENSTAGFHINNMARLEPTAAGSPRHDGSVAPKALYGHGLFGGLLVVLMLVMFSQTAQACRYTIRDIGFVDMQGPTYTLWLVNGDAELADQAKQWLGPCNVQVAVVAASADDHPIVKTLNDHRVDLAQKHIVLAAPDRTPLHLGSASNRQELEPLIRSVVESPVRKQMQREALETFAFVVTRNVEQSVVDDAIKRLREFESQLPRSIDHPVTKLQLNAEQAAEEKVLLWSLGFPAKGPAAAVRDGRGKR